MECLRALNRGALLWRPSAPLCAVCVKAASLSQTLPRCHCFYLSLLDGALRCGTLWHKKRLIPSLTLSSALLSAHSARRAAEQLFKPNIFAAENDFKAYSTAVFRYRLFQLHYPVSTNIFFTAVGTHRLKPAISNAFNCSGN